jgi:hypothetical protein
MHSAGRSIWQRVKTAARALVVGEDIGGPGYPVSPYDLFDGVRGIEAAYAAGLAAGRRTGGQRAPGHPVMTDDRVRNWARLLEKYNPYAQGMLSGLRTYTLGHKGLQVEVVSRPGSTSDDEVRAEVDGWLAAWCDRTDWWSREREVYNRAHRDGEAILRVGSDRDGVWLRPVEPEYLVSPDATPEWADGVRTREGDAEVLEAIHVRYDPAGEGETVPAEEVYFIRSNVDRCERRGVSDFASVAPLLEEAVNCLRSMLGAETERQGVVMVTHHKDTAPVDVDAMVAGNADYTYQDPVSGKTVPTQSRRGVREVHLTGKQEFAAFPDPGSIPSAIQAINTALLAVGVRYHMPLWVISGDASRNNALDLDAEGPFGRFIADEQHWYCNHVRNILWRVIEEAVDAGELPEEALEVCDLSVTPMKPTENRDPEKETNRNKTLHEAGILGKPDWSAREGLDFGKQQADLQRYPAGAVAPASTPTPAPTPAPAAGANGGRVNGFLDG